MKTEYLHAQAWQSCLRHIFWLVIAMGCSGPVVIDTTGNPLQDGEIVGVVIADQDFDLAKSKIEKQHPKPAQAAIPVSNAFIVVQNDVARAVTRTNVMGAFRITVAPGIYGVSAWSSHHGKMYSRFVTAVAMPNTSSTLPNPLVLSAARSVSVSTGFQNTYLRQRWTDFVGVADDTGTYRSSTLFPGQNALQVTHAELQSAVVAIDPEKKTQNFEIDAALNDQSKDARIYIELESDLAGRAFAWLISDANSFAPVRSQTAGVLGVAAGAYKVAAAVPGFEQTTFNIELTAGESKRIKLSAQSLGVETHSVTGVVLDADDQMPLTGAQVEIESQIFSTDSRGVWSAQILPGCYLVRVSASQRGLAEVERCVGSKDSFLGTVALQKNQACFQSVEVCDGMDNDCDGLVDQGQTCTMSAAFAADLTMAASHQTELGTISWLSIAGDYVFALAKPICPCDSATRGTLLQLDAKTLQQQAALAMTQEGFPLESIYDSQNNELLITVAKNIMGASSNGTKRLDTFSLDTNSFQRLTETANPEDNSGFMRLLHHQAEDAAMVLDRTGITPYVTKYALADGAQVGQVSLDFGASHMAHSKLSDFIYVTKSSNFFGPSNILYVLDPVAVTEVTTITTYGPPGALGISNSGEFAIISGDTSNWSEVVSVVDLNPTSATFHQQVDTATTSKYSYNKFVFYQNDSIVLGVSNQTGGSGLASMSFDNSTDPPVLSPAATYTIGQGFIRFFPLTDPTVGIGYLTEGSTIRLMKIKNF